LVRIPFVSISKGLPSYLRLIYIRIISLRKRKEGFPTRRLTPPKDVAKQESFLHTLSSPEKARFFRPTRVPSSTKWERESPFFHSVVSPISCFFNPFLSDPSPDPLQLLLEGPAISTKESLDLIFPFYQFSPLSDPQLPPHFLLDFLSEALPSFRHFEYSTSPVFAVLAPIAQGLSSDGFLFFQSQLRAFAPSKRIPEEEFTAATLKNAVLSNVRLKPFNSRVGLDFSPLT